MPWQSAVSRTVIAAAAVLTVSRAAAHPEGFSGVHVKVLDEQVRAVVTVHTRDMSAWFPPAKFPDYVPEVCREMQRTAGEIVELQLDGHPLPVAKAATSSPEVGLIQLDIDYQLVLPPREAELLTWAKHLIHLPRGHQLLLFVEDRRGVEADAASGPLLLEDILTTERDASAALAPGKGGAVPSDLPAPQAADPGEQRQPKTGADGGSHSKGGISFFWLGVEHIVTGYDHLLFLAALLLTCTKFKEAATIITCFTVAHSITLALAALDLVRLPPEVVEPAIALSIVIVACENLLTKPGLWRRAIVTCCFGLVHGLGFASVLRDIGLGTIPGGVVWPLLKFNLGVETGQLAIASVALPLLLAARRNEKLSKRLIPAGSAAVALMGAYWFITRIL